MDVQELIDIIKKERLYEYQCFQIGSPNDRQNSIWTSAEGFDNDIYGICKQSENFWLGYTIDERNNVIYMQKEFTESEACEDLLYSLRVRKGHMKERHTPKLKYIIHNPEKWFDN